METLLIAIVAAPGIVFLLLGFGWLAGFTPPERILARITVLTYSYGTLGTLALFAMMRDEGVLSVNAHLGPWFAVGSYQFASNLFVDRLSLPYMLLTVTLVGLIGAFSRRYLHRDPGYFRFFALLQLFGFGSLIIFTAGSFDLLIVGWELVGITSVLLVAFFHQRPEPVRGALYVFAMYRGTDIGLLSAAVAFHHFAHSASFDRLFRGAWPHQLPALDGGSATLIALLLVLAAAGKSAQIPFSGWLPRAMEGPTPSSAVFYGAIAVHAGTYLLLRAHPILAASPVASTLVILIGALTAIHGTMVGRACADAKTYLAYASLTQMGIIFVEIGFGFQWLAVIHVAGHAATRTLQFLRAPSMLHDFHQIHAAAGGHLTATGAYYESIIPGTLRDWLYRFSLDRGHLDTVLERFFIGPLERAAQALSAMERIWSPPRPGPAAPEWSPEILEITWKDRNTARTRQ
jgi:NADH:ubiquinone oxidoreductase subunit 5 (subunit L)/multisubunit Na+/H+ antiporter MnhA subunit